MAHRLVIQLVEAAGTQAAEPALSPTSLLGLDGDMSASTCGERIPYDSNESSALEPRGIRRTASATICQTCTAAGLGIPVRHQPVAHTDQCGSNPR